jgi:hypothetical protein
MGTSNTNQSVMPIPKRVAFLFVMDSQIKICLPLSEALKREGWEVDFFQLPSESKYLTTREHASELGMKHFKQTELESFFKLNQAFGYGVIIALLCGYENYLFSKYYSKHVKASDQQWRPITVGGVFGIEILKKRKGYALRSAFDIVYLTAEIDRSLSKKRYPFLALDNLQATGLPFLDTIYKQRNQSTTKANRGFTVLYACQNLFPATPQERNYLIQQLADWCHKHPEDRLLFKPRHRKEQDSLQPVIYHEEDSIRDVLGNKIPKNFILTYTPINQLLRETDLCLTISSTASFEAIALGIPVGYLKDEVIQNPDYGYWYLEGSGCLYNFQDLNSKRCPSPNPEWLKTHFKCNGKNCEDLLKEVFLKIKKQQQLKAPLPMRRWELFFMDYSIAIHKHIQIWLLSKKWVPSDIRKKLKRSLHQLKGISQLRK